MIKSILSVFILLINYSLANAQHHHTVNQIGLHHWEIPSKDPDRIILTFNGNPATSRAVTWRTNTTITKAIAEIAVATVNPSLLKQILMLLPKSLI